MQELLNTKNSTIKGSFFCRGKFWILNRDKPNEEDIKNAKNFAKQMKK